MAYVTAAEDRNSIEWKLANALRENERLQEQTNNAIAKWYDALGEIERLNGLLLAHQRTNAPLLVAQAEIEQPDEGLPTADDVRGILRESKP